MPDQARRDIDADIIKTTAWLAMEAKHNGISTQLELEQGKYIIVNYVDGSTHIFRYGEQWRDVTGDNVIFFLVAMIEDQRTLLENVVTDLETTITTITDVHKEDVS